MAGNEISKLLQIALSPQNLRQTSSDSSIFDPFQLQTGNSQYETALRKSLKTENRRVEAETPARVPREQPDTESTPSRAEESLLQRRERTTENNREPSRSEPTESRERTGAAEGDEDRGLPRTQSEPEAKTTHEKSSDRSSDRNSDSEQAVEPTAAFPSDQAVENSGNQDQPIETAVGIEEETGDVSSPVTALTEIVSLLVQNSNETSTNLAPPSSFGRELFQQLRRADAPIDSVELPTLLNIDSEGDESLPIPGQLLGLIAQTVGAEAASGQSGETVDAEKLAATIQELVINLASNTTESNTAESSEAPPTTVPEKPELVNQIVETITEQVAPVEQPALNVNTTSASETAVEPNAIPQARPIEQPTANINPTVEPTIPTATAEVAPDEQQTAGPVDVVNVPTEKVLNVNSSDAPEVAQPDSTETESNQQQSEAPPVEETDSEYVQPVTNQTDPEGSAEAGKQVTTEPEVTGQSRPVSEGDVVKSDRPSAKTESSETTDEGDPITDTNRPRPETNAATRSSAPVPTGLEAVAPKVTLENAKPTSMDSVPVVNAIDTAPASKAVAADRTAVRPTGPTTTLPHVQSQEFLERLSDSVRVADKNHQQLKVRLTPPQLGSMHIEVTRQEGVVMARLEVQSTTAQQLLLDQLSGLKEMLQQQGHNVERIEVQLQEPSRSDQSSQQQGGQEGDSEQEAKRQPRQQHSGQSSQQDEGEEESGAEQRDRSPGTMENIDVEI